jgi:hypothetical protein
VGRTEQAGKRHGESNTNILDEISKMTSKDGSLLSKTQQDPNCPSNLDEGRKR